MVALPTEVEKPEGEAGFGRGEGDLVWIRGGEWLPMGTSK